MGRPSSFSGVHHIKLATSNLDNSKAFYTDIAGLVHISKFDHFTKDGTLFAVMLEGGHRGVKLLVELRMNPGQAEKQQYWDPITWAVPLRSDLDLWKEWFMEHDVKCSKVFTAIQGWVLCALDPDDKIVRLYCDESHEWTTDFDTDEFWLRM